MSAASSTDSADGPDVIERRAQGQDHPSVLSSPSVELQPDEAARRGRGCVWIRPARCRARPMHIPSATDTADPPEDPPGDRPRSSGWHGPVRTPTPRSFTPARTRAGSSCRRRPRRPRTEPLDRHGIAARDVVAVARGDAAVVAEPRTSNQIPLIEIRDAMEERPGNALPRSRDIGGACLLARVGFEHRDGERVAGVELRTAIRCRHPARTASAVMSRAFSARDSSAMCTGLTAHRVRGARLSDRARRRSSRWLSGARSPWPTLRAAA